MRTQFTPASPITPALAISIALVALYNGRFWSEMIAAMFSGSAGDTFFLASLFALLVFLHTIFLLLIPGKRAFQLIVSVLFVVAALSSYSADTYGVRIDREMVHNLIETDHREVRALLSPRLALYLLGLGIIPALLVWRLNPQRVGVGRQLRSRALFIVGALALSAVMVFGSFSRYAEFAREHRSLRYLLSPASAVAGTVGYIRDRLPEEGDAGIMEVAGPSTRLAHAASDKPLLMFLVIGETARSRDFQLGGYARETNPELAKTTGVFYFSQVSSCGTSTAVSLPCMFSALSREESSVAKRARTPNLLDSLSGAGLTVEWYDNNSGGKKVNDRVKTVSYPGDPRDPTLCDAESCMDEILLTGLDERLRALDNDAVLVFHEMGNHGPAYYRRYPKRFEVFTPVCRTNQFKECSDEAIRNAYDNAVLYTDHNLARQIELLKSVSQRFDTVLIYISDHGESLGENGLYLHGAPLSLAPDEQTRVPFVLWMSPGYQQRFRLAGDCLAAQLGKAFRHENLYHTVLASMDVRNAAFRPALDMLAPCRTPG